MAISSYFYSIKKLDKRDSKKVESNLSINKLTIWDTKKLILNLSSKKEKFTIHFQYKSHLSFLATLIKRRILIIFLTNLQLVVMCTRQINLQFSWEMIESRLFRTF